MLAKMLKIKLSEALVLHPLMSEEESGSTTKSGPVEVEVDMAEDGNYAIEAYMKNFTSEMRQYSAVTMDGQMPILDGSGSPFCASGL